MNETKGIYFLKESGTLTILYYKIATLNELIKNFPNLNNDHFLINNYILRFFVFKDNSFNYDEYMRPACFNIIKQCIINNVSCSFYEPIDKIVSIFPEVKNLLIISFWLEAIINFSIGNPIFFATQAEKTFPKLPVGTEKIILFENTSSSKADVK